MRKVFRELFRRRNLPADLLQTWWVCACACIDVIPPMNYRAIGSKVRQAKSSRFAKTHITI